MEKTEYKIRMDQMENLVRQGDLKGAVEAISDLNYRKIRNINVLLRASDVCDMAGEPEKAREILEIAHEKSPMARMTIYKLALLSVKLGDFEEAESYYNEFIDLAPHDGLRFIIQYTIRKAQGADTTELISILEELCKEDFIDKWAFELACLYRTHGDEKKCVDICDQIALWFGEGPYVEKALEMKMLYKPLTKEQEEQYRQITSSESADPAAKKKSDTITIPKIEETPDKFDTVNLQAEIRKNIEEIMLATEKGEVSANMDNIKDLVGDIPYVTAGQSALDKHRKQPEPEKEESQTPIEDAYQQYLAEEYDGQMALNLTAHADDDQIEGQLTIDDVLEDWGRKQRAMEAALNEARRKELDKAKELALREANQIMDRLVDISPQLEAGVAPEEILKKEYLKEDKKEPEEIMAGVNDMLQHDIDTMSDEPAEKPVEPEQKAEEEQEEKQPEKPEEPAEEKKEEPEKKEEAEKPQEPEEKQEPEEQPADKAEEKDKPEKEEKPEEKDDSTKDLSDLKEDTQEVRHGIDISGLADAIERAELDDEKVETDFTDDEKDVLTYFTEVHGMKEQLLQALRTLKVKEESHGNMRAGNLTIAGGDGCGKTTLASRLVQLTQKATGGLKGEAGRITGASLNSKDMNAIISKVRGGSLMIERAGGMNHDTAVSLALLIENDRSGTLFILEDSKKSLDMLSAGTPKLWKYFTQHIEIPEMTLDELVNFAKVYVLECGYSMEDMGILALYDRISIMRSGDENVGLNAVREVIDDAIARYKKRSKGFFGRLSARYTDEDGRPMLQEKDIIDY